MAGARLERAGDSVLSKHWRRTARRLDRLSCDWGGAPHACEKVTQRTRHPAPGTAPSPGTRHPAPFSVYPPPAHDLIAIIEDDRLPRSNCGLGRVELQFRAIVWQRSGSCAGRDMAMTNLRQHMNGLGWGFARNPVDARCGQ